MEKTPESASLNDLLRALAAVAGRLDDEAATRTAARLAARFQQPTKTDTVFYLSVAFAKIGGRMKLDDETTARTADRLAILLMEQTGIRFFEVDAIPLKRSLAVVGGRFTTPELVRLLQKPVFADAAQREVLAVLGQRTRREFRSAWHFLDWAESNGVDLHAPAAP